MTTHRSSPEAARFYVNRGAALLDDYYKQGDWWSRIDIDRLNIQDCHQCVLGQLMEFFSVGIHRINNTMAEGLLDEAACFYGFDKVVDTSIQNLADMSGETWEDISEKWYVGTTTWEDLRTAWVEIITARTKAY